MTIRTGASTYIGAQLGTAWGTAVAAGAKDKLVVNNFNYNTNQEELSINPIGSGLEMTNETALGATNPTLSFSAPVQYEGPQLLIESIFFGGASVTAEATGTYTHSLIYNATRPAKYLTVGWHNSSATAMEMNSGLPTEISYDGQKAPAYLNKSVTIIGDQITTGTTNTAATLLTTTLASSKYIVLRKQDYFYINAQAGAGLAVGDKLNVTGLTWKLSRPQEPVAEVSGAASATNSLPRSSGNPPFEATITVTLRGVNDLTYFTAHTAGTEYKAEIGISGDIITGAIPYMARFMFPRLKIMAFPDANISTPGENPYSITFKALVAASVPTGMLDIYPHEVYTNTQATQALTAL